MAGQVKNLVAPCQLLQEAASLTDVGIVQIDEGIIQNDKHLLIPKQRIHQCKAHAQHHKVHFSRTEIGKFSGLSQPL